MVFINKRSHTQLTQNTTTLSKGITKVRDSNDSHSCILFDILLAYSQSIFFLARLMQNSQTVSVFQSN